jgi:hypothetical protein
MMDDFLNIAIWILMSFLMINASIMWFQSSDTFTTYGLDGTGYQEQNIIDYNGLGIDVDASTVTSDELQYPPGILTNVLDLGTSITGWFWNLLTAWITVLNLTLSSIGAVGTLMKMVLIPFFVLVEIFAIIVIAMKIAGIIRGGS